MSTLRAGAAAYMRSEGTIAVSMGVMSMGTFGFQIAATRFLGPGHYGALGSLMNVLLVVGVVQLGLQATAARRIASDPQHVKQIERVVLTVTNVAALLFGGVLLIAAPLVNWALKLGDVRLAILVALCAVPMTITGGQAGVLQGELRWWPLAIQYVAAGVPRLVIGVAFMAWRPTELWGMVGVTIGAFIPMLVGAYALRHERPTGMESDLHRGVQIAWESLHNSQALLAFVALSNIDLAVIARHVLNAHATGLYAAGLIVTKVVLFLPQFVVVTAFPTMSTPHERRRALVRSLILMAAVGAVSTLGSYVLSGVALIFIGGHQYSGVQSELWIFAILGTLLSMLQLLVYSVLARQGRWPVLLIWAALIALTSFGWLQSTVTSLLWTVVAVDGALFAALLLLAFRALGEPVDAFEAEVAVSA
ncbi:MAG: lipopolysaccharide biosynthesis protein [Marmoricola sp.]